MIDTSSLVAAANEMYPIESFPGFWEKLDELIASGELISSVEVFEELKQREGDELFRWAKDRRHMYWDLAEDVQRHASAVLTALPALTDVNRGRSGADPFVVAQAAAVRATVVTQERKGSYKPPRIPEACAVVGVRCIRLVELVREQGWKFVAR